MTCAGIAASINRLGINETAEGTTASGSEVIVVREAVDFFSVLVDGSTGMDWGFSGSLRTVSSVLASYRFAFTRLDGAERGR